MRLIIMGAYVLTSHDRILTLMARVSLVQTSFVMTPSEVRITEPGINHRTAVRRRLTLRNGGVRPQLLHAVDLWVHIDYQDRFERRMSTLEECQKLLVISIEATSK